jgi:hypothetical protein
LVVRLYEWAGRQGAVRLRLPKPVSSAAETRLMERGSRDPKLDRGDAVCPMAPYEIKTIIGRFAPCRTGGPFEVDEVSRCRRRAVLRRLTPARKGRPSVCSRCRPEGGDGLLDGRA